MPRIMVLNEGRKRKLRAIRWTFLEKVSAVALLVILVVFCVMVALLMADLFEGDVLIPRVELRR